MATFKVLKNGACYLVGYKVGGGGLRGEWNITALGVRWPRVKPQLHPFLE